MNILTQLRILKIQPMLFHLYLKIFQKVNTIISFYAKKARGLMTAWILKNKVKDNELKNFNVDGYYFAKDESTENSPVFLKRLVYKIVSNFQKFFCA